MHTDRVGAVSRRAFVESVVSGALTVATVSSVPRELTAQLMAGQSAADPLLELSAAEAVAAMTRGDITAERYATSLLARARAVQSLNAFITLDADRVLADARAADRRRGSQAALGRLHGLPIPIKDSINVQGYPATNGTAALRTFAPPTDAALVTRLRNEGAIVLGKTNLHELSMGFTSDNPHFGTARNPYDPTRHPGGSSGGTGIAVATQCAPIGIAEDTGGSIRVPAAACGVAGFRPTHGRYPNEGTLPLQPIFDQLGPIARRVSDIVLFDGVITGESVTLAPTPLRGLRLGIMRGFHDLVLDDDTARVWQEVERRLADAGVQLVDVQIPELVNVWNTIAVPMILNDAVPAITDALARFETGVTMQQLRDGASPEVRGLMQLAGRVEPNADVRQRLLLARSSAQQRIEAAITSADVRALIFPAMPLIPQRKQDRGPITVNGRQVPHDDHLVRNIAPCSTFGMAGLVVPAALGASGLPVCVEIDGVPGSDRSVLAIGLALEALLCPVSAPQIG